MLSVNCCGNTICIAKSFQRLYYGYRKKNYGRIQSMNMVTLPVSTIDRVEKKLVRALEEVRALKSGHIKKAQKPIRFWTKAQWEKAEREADEDIRAGRIYRLNSVEDLDKSLSELAR